MLLGCVRRPASNATVARRRLGAAWQVRRANAEALAWMNGSGPDQWRIVARETGRSDMSVVDHMARMGVFLGNAAMRYRTRWA